jgi:hypothetical protein
LSKFHLVDPNIFTAIIIQSDLINLPPYSSTNSTDPNGIQIGISFDLKIGASGRIYVMHYLKSNGEVLTLYEQGKIAYELLQTLYSIIYYPIKF